jgi:hypothetical protein
MVKAERFGRLLCARRERPILPFLKLDVAPNPIFAGHSYDCEGSELSVP